ncbi:Acetyltransferase (GNAT) domain-containing protein [Modestobacter sp. DSM 44400]|uniref:GNAT family N-acetyltransferase n=1 Tax=Modestobacter sp. DSM 44400 TaxID=1550230 RepID=UPI0008941D5A|nr:GNAT family N-acetyltransferase [Modestobacter sp. DSM 44400]SDY87512.1 Acetyltransferase (GNAT) domain-containing protein [Modestobacter sp. DSM 44400]
MASAERWTKRLRLEPIGRDSADRLLELPQDPGVAAWDGDAWTEERAASFAATVAEQWARDGVGKWLAYDREGSRLVGRGGLSYVELLGRRQLEVGWAIREQRWGRGLATEIGRAALHVAFDELGPQQVVAFTEVHSIASRRVMHRAWGRTTCRTFAARASSPAATSSATTPPSPCTAFGVPADDRLPGRQVPPVGTGAVAPTSVTSSSR